MGKSSDKSRSPTPQPEMTSTPINCTVQTVAAAQSGPGSKIIMKTVNDTLFDVSLIKKFNRNDYRKTKVCRESIKPAVHQV